ncbi:MAG: hypothetical protein H6Q74_460 [Firmicutes bacterium]|nr:hypothetical protein [Bacillota bacterium]
MDENAYDELQRALRAQRHQFMNHLQVIYALVELKRNDKALKYIEELAKNPDLLTEPFIEQDSAKVHSDKKTG